MDKHSTPITGSPNPNSASKSAEVGPMDRNRGVYISTYGCQMNVNDTERMHTLLEMMNYTPVSTPEQAAVIIINSCSVREKPVHKVHSEAGRYRKLKKFNPNLKIGVTGCVAQQEKTNLMTDIPSLDFVLGTDAIDRLPQILSRVEQGHKVVSAQFDHQSPYQIETLVRNPGVATFVNITKGCDNFCTFCVVPFTRGRERSRALAELVSDVQSLVKRGVREVTLLGQNVNSYRSSCGADFADLLRVLATDTDIWRLRYTTSHPKDFNQKLVDVMQAYRSKICDYVHLPVQSGNSEVLHRMNRGYTREEYLDKVQMILASIPGVVLSTDMIVGFPGETEEQFEDTMRLIEEVDYDSVYSFKYSPRPFTKAARFTEQIDEETKSKRLSRLQDRHDERAFELAKRFFGQVYDVLVENFDPKTERCTGRSTQNKVVHFRGQPDWVGSVLKVKVREAFPQTLRGEAV